MILHKTIELIRSNYLHDFNDLQIADVCFGVNLTAVKLSNGSCGVASTLEDTEAHCLRTNRDYSDFSTTKIIGQKAMAIFEIEKETSLVKTLRIAILNALSNTLIAKGKYTIIEGKDPIDLLDLNQHKTITIVGAFTSYIKHVADTDNQLYVLELNEDELIEDHKRFYVPASEYQRVIPQSDIVIITGFTLVNNTIDGLLSSVLPGTQVVITGPSSSLIPDVLFEKGVAMIGATRITDPDLLFQVAGQYGKGYHLFKYCAEKICILKS